MQRIALGGVLLLAASAVSSPDPANAQRETRPKSVHARKGTANRAGHFAGVARRLEEAPAGAPVSIAVLPAGWADPQHQRLQVVVTPHVDARLMEVAVDATEGLVLPAGKSRWSAPARAGQAAGEPVVIGASGPGQQRLLVTVTLRFDGDERQGAVALFMLHPEAPPLKNPHPGARRVTTPDGRVILEIPAGRPASR
jgi:hypothetical protein